METKQKDVSMYISHLLNCSWFLQSNCARYFSVSVCVCVYLHVRLCVSGVGVCVFYGPG